MRLSALPADRDDPCLGHRGRRPPRAAAQPADHRRRDASTGLEEAVENHFPAGLVEVNGELVAVDAGHGAGSELGVEDSLAVLEGGGRARGFGDQLALDLPRTARAATPALSPVQSPPNPPEVLAWARCQPGVP